MIRSTVAVFSQDSFDWTDKVGSFRRFWPPGGKATRGGAVRDEWDMVKHGDIVLLHLCETDHVACDAFTLAVAASSGFVSTVRYLVGERGVNPAAINNCAFRFAAGDGHSDVVQLLIDLPLERGVDPVADNNYAVRYAAKNGHTGVVQLLLALPIGRRPSRAVVQDQLSNVDLSPTTASILAEHLAETDPAP